jgi:RNA polymerase sigma factor (sigma-70 family)
MHYVTHSDAQLVALLKDSDNRAFTDIYNRYWDKLYFLAHRHLKSPAVSEEIVQEVFLVLWKRRAELTIRSLPFYLAAMTRYAVYHHLADQKKYRETELTALRAEPGTVGEELTLDNKYLLEIIEKLSNQLPEKCRLVFVYNKLLDQPLSEVAEALHISPKTAEAHLTKALKVIRGGLSDTFSLLFFL